MPLAGRRGDRKYTLHTFQMIVVSVSDTYGEINALMIVNPLRHGKSGAYC